MEKLELPYNQKKVLLHVCCATCSGGIIERMVESDLSPTVFFYNPNIHPVAEYEKRKAEVVSFCGQLGVEYVDVDYDVQNWFARIKGLEKEPERGGRCTKCFDMRMERTALYAHEHEFKVMATSLSISRWKDQKQVHGAGDRAAARYDDLLFWDYNWRKSGGMERMYQVAKEQDFYRQQYCGCVFSVRET